LKRAKLERRTLPVSGLTTLVASPETLATLNDIVMVEKVRGLMTTRWGFKGRVGRSNCVLVFGPQGCGKTFAAACVGFETGRPLQTVSMSELVTLREMGAIGDLFRESSIAGAVVVIEQAEQLLIEASRKDQANSPGLELLYHVQTYNGLCILCCTTTRNPTDSGWDAFQPVPSRVSNLLSYLVVLDKPNAAARLQLWKQGIPAATPLDPSVDSGLTDVADKYEFTGARINSVIRRAAAAAAMRANRASLIDCKSQSKTSLTLAANVTIKDMTAACDAEMMIEKAAGGLQYGVNLYV
jgi:SpoVK/Ycf46/Vps4 family AAA+-type ATPase